MFMETSGYPGLTPLCEGWQDVRDELHGLEGRGFLEWPERFLYSGDWSVFPLYRFGEKIVSTCAACPRTTALIEGVPGMVTAGFSKLAPGTHIEPHTGYTGAVLRFHLGLTKAEGCALRVGTETRAWAPGSAFVFDDTTEHEAWNHGDADRVILLLDFKRDPDADIAFPEQVRNYGGDL